MVIVAMIPTFVSRWIVYGGPFETGYVSIRDFPEARPGTALPGFLPDTCAILFYGLGRMLSRVSALSSTALSRLQ